MSKAYPQRFNTPVLGAVYLSREPDTAAAEALRRIARDTRLVGSADLAAAFDRVMPRSIFVVQVRLRAVLGLSTRVALDAWGLRADSLAADDFAPCQEVATLAAKNGAEGVRWASATGAGESVALFWDQRHAGSHVDLVDEFPVERHWFEDIVNGTPVSHFLPALHDYPRYALDSASHP